MCVFLLWSARSLCVYKEGDKSDETSTDARPTPSGLDVIIIACVLVLASMQTAFSSQKPWYDLVFFSFFCIFSHFFKGAVGDRVLSCIISLLPKCLCQGSAGRTPLFLHIYGIVFPSSEAIRTVWEQPAVPSLKCWTDFLILKACVHECLFSFTGRMCSAQCCHAKILVMTSSLLSLLDCHDVNDSNSATTLRLCSYSFFFCQLGQGVVEPVCQLLSYQEKP